MSPITAMGRLAGAVLAHTALFAALVARMAGINEGECERTVAVARTRRPPFHPQ